MFAFAVLYFTGSGHYNMSMRAFAKAKGLKLSDQGLFKVNTVNGKQVHKFEDSYRCGLVVVTTAAEAAAATAASSVA